MQYKFNFSHNDQIRLMAKQPKFTFTYVISRHFAALMSKPMCQFESQAPLTEEVCFSRRTYPLTKLFSWHYHLAETANSDYIPTIIRSSAYVILSCSTCLVNQVFRPVKASTGKNFAHVAVEAHLSHMTEVSSKIYIGYSTGTAVILPATIYGSLTVRMNQKVNFYPCYLASLYIFCLAVFIIFVLSA